MICVSSDVVGVIGGAHGILVLSSILYSLSEQWKKENPPIQILARIYYLYRVTPRADSGEMPKCDTTSIASILYCSEWSSIMSRVAWNVKCSL